MSAPDLKQLPGIDLKGNEPVFNEPWEAHAFAMAIELHQKGAFTWSEWADALGACVKDDDGQTGYYQLWLQALEILVAQKALVSHDELINRASDWRRALSATPHGQPIVLQNGEAGTGVN
ncbi:MAG: nitrile hydratase accessory protein [Pseudomonadota bacterium]